MHVADDGGHSAVRDQLPRHPSEYLNRNVYFGASFASAFEVEQAVINRVESRVVWGSDYPHVEGTYLKPTDESVPSVTRLALRNTFRNVAPAVTRKIVGGNLIDLYGLDRSRLESIATRIGALTPAEITEPVTEIPAGASKHAFRTTEVWT